jgi:hypothetical protein
MLRWWIFQTVYMKFHKICIVAISILLVSGCFLSTDDCFKEYDLAIEVTLSPALDTFDVGDTIWISSRIPTELTNSITGEAVDVTDVNFPVDFTIDQVDTMDFAPSEKDFSYIQRTGELFFQELSAFTSIRLFYKDSIDGQYIHFGIVPLEPAIYLLAFSVSNPDLNEIVFSDCSEKKRLRFTTNDNIDNNYYYIEQSNNPWVSVSEEGYYSWGRYAFLVRP